MLNKKEIVPLLFNSVLLEQTKLENYVDNELNVKVNLYDEVDRIISLLKSKYERYIVL